MLLWLLAILGALVAAMAFAKARRVALKLEQLTQLYWELRYEHTRLRARVGRLDPESSPVEDPGPQASATPAAFVPLSSLKR
jgi:hypothetical protein